MAITIVNQTTDTSDRTDMQNEVSMTDGNWLVAVVTWNYLLSSPLPNINITDSPRNVWSLLSTRVQQATNTVAFTGHTMNTQVWACPAVHFAGWPYDFVVTSIQSCLGGDLGSFAVDLIEVAGMGNNWLTVDTVATFAAYNSNSLTMSLPAAGANSLMIASAAGSIAYGSYTTTGTGWTQLANNTATTPDLGAFGAWREGSTATSVTFALVAGFFTDWTGVIVSIRTSGTAPAQPNPNWPGVECQFGFGYDLSVPLSTVWWTDQTQRYWAINTKRGIQYELGDPQAEPTNLTMRNDDGTFSPRNVDDPPEIVATGAGSTTTFVCNATDAAGLSTSDIFRLSYSAINSNTGFESGTTGWTATGGSLASIVVGSGHVGQLTPNGVTANVFAESTHITVTPGQFYDVSGLFQVPIARTAQLQIRWYDSGGTFINAAAIVTPTMTANTLYSFSGSFVAPTNAATGAIAGFMGGTPPATNLLLMDEMILKPADEYTAFQIKAISTTGGTSTVTYGMADLSAGGSLFATKAGDVLVATPIDMYTPYRVLMSWNGKREYVNAGWVERWPQTWRDPHWGIAGALTVGALSGLTAANPTALAGDIMRRQPHDYWPLSDAAGSQSASNVSGRGLSQLVVTDLKAGTADQQTADFGVTTQGVNNDPDDRATVPFITTLMGDPGTAWNQTFNDDQTVSPPPGSTDLNNKKGVALVAKDSGFPSITNGVSIFFCGTLSLNDQDVIQNSSINPTAFILRNTDPSAGAQGSVIKVDWDRATSGYPAVTVWDKSTHANTRTVCSTGFGSQMISQWITWTLVFDNNDWAMYTGNNLAGSGTCNLVSSFSIFDFGGESDQFFSGNAFPGLFCHVAIFDRKLSAGEVQDLTAAAEVAWGNDREFTSNRVQRKLDTMGMRTGRIMDAAGQILCDGEGTDASTIADVCNQVGAYEDTLIFEDAGGNYQYRPPGRYARQQPRAVIGENVAGGEIPYLGNIETDFDPTYLYNAITIENTVFNKFAFEQSIASSQFAAFDDASATKYNIRTFGRSTRISGNHLEQVFYLAYWLLSQFSTPQQRFQTVTLDPASNPTLWSFCLTVEVGDILIVNRRPIGAPTITSTCVVMQVSHDGSPSNWKTTLTLAPARSSGLVTNDTVQGIIGNNFLTME